MKRPIPGGVAQFDAKKNPEILIWKTKREKKLEYYEIMLTLRSNREAPTHNSSEMLYIHKAIFNKIYFNRNPQSNLLQQINSTILIWF